MNQNAQNGSPTERAKRDARVFIEGLAQRLGELMEMADRSGQFQAFEQAEYGRFKQLFLNFTDRTEEFQLLSALTEEALMLLERVGAAFWAEHKELGEYYRKLQIAMLQQAIATQLRLLKVWEDRWRRGDGLPYGSSELFAEALRVTSNAKAQLIRPRYVSMVDEQTLTNAENALLLIKTLIRSAPKYHDFEEDADFDDPRVSGPREDDRQPFLPGIEATSVNPTGDSRP